MYVQVLYIRVLQLVPFVPSAQRKEPVESPCLASHQKAMRYVWIVRQNPSAHLSYWLQGEGEKPSRSGMLFWWPFLPSSCMFLNQKNPYDNDAV